MFRDLTTEPTETWKINVALEFVLEIVSFNNVLTKLFMKAKDNLIEIFQLFRWRCVDCVWRPSQIYCVCAITIGKKGRSWVSLFKVLV